MEVSANRESHAAARWHELIVGMAQEIDELADRFVSEVRAIPSYSSGIVSDEELVEWAQKSMGLILSGLATKSKSPVFAAAPLELGRRRARQGISAEDLMTAIRLDFRVLWSTVVSRAQESDAFTLMLNIEDLWGVVDEYANEALRAFQEERAIMAAAAQDQQHGYLTELLSDGLSPRKIELTARAINVEEHGVFSVVACDARFTASARKAAMSLAVTGHKLFVVNRPGHLVLIWPEPASGRPAPQRAALGEIAGGYVPLVRGLERVPSAAETAWELLRTMSPDADGLVDLTSAWPRIVRPYLDRHQGYVSSVLEALDSLTDAERAAIVETVGAYLATGSVARCAEQLYCHRNTVLNRLARFKALSQIDVTVPKQAALAVVALS